jgi:hypothetical protein
MERSAGGSEILGSGLQAADSAIDIIDKEQEIFI